jgi:thioesterase domain-containing protein
MNGVLRGVLAADQDVAFAFAGAACSGFDVRIVHTPADAGLARELISELECFTDAVAVDVRSALVMAPQPTTVFNVAARLARKRPEDLAGTRLIVVGLGRVGGAIARALAAELLGLDEPVEAVLVLDCVAGNGGVMDPADDLAGLVWSEPLIVWNQQEDARRVRSFIADVLPVGVSWLRERIMEISAEEAFSSAPPTLLTLRSGKPEGEQIFCIPGAGASVISFLDLAQVAPAGLAIHGLQPRGLDGTSTPYSTVQSTAEALEPLIIEQHGVRPVHLVGHSFGGCVAFELACRLRERGRPPASLSLIDTRPPRDALWPDDVGDVDVARSWINLNELAVEQSMGIDENDLQRGDLLHNMAIVHRGMVRVGLLPSNTLPTVLLGPMRMFATCVRTWYHTTTIYPEPMRLIYLDDPFTDLAGNARIAAASRSGWSALAPQFEFRRGSGNHITGLKMPHAAKLSELLGWRGAAC